ncbi:MAG TPA: CDGSH iron-sulfur domain-containing protein, partial [Spongiibacteraceae bacterium]
RFCAIRTEWRALKAARPTFVPARTVARNPVMRSPMALDRIQIVAEPAAQLLDAANAAYGLMLRQLALMSDEALCPRELRRSVGEQTLGLMHLVAALGTELTTLPANREHPDVNAGITFTVSRSALSFQSPDSAAAIMAERYTEIAARLQSLTVHMPDLKRYAAMLNDFAQQWRERAGTTKMKTPATPPLSPLISTAISTAKKPLADAPVLAAGKVDVARGTAVEVRFDHSRCIHSRHCVLDEPTVFIANKPGEWIYPDAVSAERIAQVAHNCPSGAITYTRLDGGENELAPLVNVIRVRENGPLAVKATLIIDGQESRRATLCRCGLSNNKPYCDSSHVAANFTASGESSTRSTEPLAARDGPLEVTPLRNGPLDVRGNLEICCGTGRIIDRLTATQLCRCGHSNDKPFCDGSHALVGFEASGAD